jgi:hypothetical protein
MEDFQRMNGTGRIPSFGGSPFCLELFANFEEVKIWGHGGAESCEVAFASLCAANAACGGGLDAITFLREWSNAYLWSIHYDYRRLAPGLVIAVEYLCRNTYLDAPVQGITRLLSDLPRGSEKIHGSIYGSNGTVMHLAAAESNKKLLKALMFNIGIFAGAAVPSMLVSNNAKDAFKRFTPAEWASNRGYLELAEQLKPQVCAFVAGLMSGM